MFKTNLFLRAGPAGVDKFRAGIEPDALTPEHLLQGCCRIRIELMQNVRTALDHRYMDAKPDKELRELRRNSSAAEHDDRFGQPRKAEGRVAGHHAELL